MTASSIDHSVEVKYESVMSIIKQGVLRLYGAGVAAVYICMDVIYLKLYKHVL